MNALTFRQIDPHAAHFSRQLGAGATLAFSAQGLPGELTLRPMTAETTEPHSLTWFDSALGILGLSDADALLSLLGELPVTLSGDPQPWYWQALNQRFSPVIAELLSPLVPLSTDTALPTAAVTCRIQLQWGDQCLHGVIRATADVLLRVLQGADWRRHRQALDEQWPVRQPLELGELSLSLAQLASLQPGDVLLPTLSHFHSDGQGRLNLGGRQWAVHTDSDERQLYVRLSHEETLEHGQ